MADELLCKIDGCDKAASKRGWCGAHYRRWQRHGDPLGGGYARTKNSGSCKIDECENPSATRGWCQFHYQRWHKFGDPLHQSGKTKPGEPIEFCHTIAAHTEKDGCVFWPFGRFTNGYGHVHYEGSSTGAHRVVCRIAHGEPSSEDLVVAHSCNNGNRGCVNPNHLRWATHVGNAQDRISHGTQVRGENHGMSLLTDKDVKEIAQLLAVETQANLAARFGVSQATISNIHTGKKWKHIHGMDGRITPKMGGKNRS